MKPVALVLLVAQLVVTVAIVPESPLAHLTEPTYLATLSAGLVTFALVVMRFVDHPAWLERLVLALFLAAMPIVYAWCAILRGDSTDLAIESVGIVGFGAAAVVGYLRIPWLVGAGIIVHGLGWDAWHHARSGYVPDWYSAGCLTADIGVGVFALVYLRRLPETEHRISHGEPLPRHM